MSEITKDRVSERIKHDTYFAETMAKIADYNLSHKQLLELVFWLIKKLNIK
jgi:hypothetical protein